MKRTNQQKRLTIKELLNSIEEMMKEDPRITLDSEIIISDMNMSNFKHEIKAYPTYDYKDEKMKVGLYLNPYEKDELVEDEEETKEEHKIVNTKAIQAIVDTLKKVTTQPKVQELQESAPVETPAREMAWLNKYSRR